MFKQKSVDSIISVFTKMISDLEKLQETLVNDNTKKLQIINNNTDEINKARQVLTKLKEIV